MHCIVNDLPKECEKESVDQAWAVQFHFCKLTPLKQPEEMI